MRAFSFDPRIIQTFLTAAAEPSFWQGKGAGRDFGLYLALCRLAQGDAIGLKALDDPSKLDYEVIDAINAWRSLHPDCAVIQASRDELQYEAGISSDERILVSISTLVKNGLVDVIVAGTPDRHFQGGSEHGQATIYGIPRMLPIGTLPSDTYLSSSSRARDTGEEEVLVTGEGPDRQHGAELVKLPQMDRLGLGSKTYMNEPQLLRLLVWAMSHGIDWYEPSGADLVRILGLTRSAASKTLKRWRERGVTYNGKLWVSSPQWESHYVDEIVHRHWMDSKVRERAMAGEWKPKAVLTDLSLVTVQDAEPDRHGVRWRHPDVEATMRVQTEMLRRWRTSGQVLTEDEIERVAIGGPVDIEPELHSMLSEEEARARVKAALAEFQAIVAIEDERTKRECVTRV